MVSCSFPRFALLIRLRLTSTPKREFVGINVNRLEMLLVICMHDKFLGMDYWHGGLVSWHWFQYTYD